MARLVLILLFVCLSQGIFAADGELEPIPGMVDPDSPLETVINNSSLDSTKKLRIENEFWYIVLLSALCVTTLTIVLTFLKDHSHSAKDIVNATGLTLIIFGTIILVMVVNTSEQLTAAIGILGAIAGYLFRSVQDDSGSKSKA
ncbi:MAG: hypothetical protein OEZ58_09005 [Gammaproteobacteria bacterium]|nr:hypothetical protein [Gammaproteobacteria bacterium]MDH5729115.1 hypothetical protein [Gammaproteobacteria bacterium]